MSTAVLQTPQTGSVRRDNGQTTRSFAPALLQTSIYSTAIAEACNRNKPPVGDDFPVARTRCDGDVRPGKAVPSGHRGRRPDERIPLQQFRWFNAERQISWQPRNKVEVSEAGKKAANIPTAVNSAFRVVRAGLARLAPLFFLTSAVPSCYRCPTD